MKSVPATPEFFDIAGGYITYNQNGVDPQTEAAKYAVQGGLFSAIGGFFGGSKWGMPDNLLKRSYVQNRLTNIVIKDDHKLKIYLVKNYLNKNHFVEQLIFK